MPKPEAPRFTLILSRETALQQLRAAHDDAIALAITNALKAVEEDAARKKSELKAAEARVAALKNPKTAQQAARTYIHHHVGSLLAGHIRMLEAQTCDVVELSGTHPLRDFFGVPRN